MKNLKLKVMGTFDGGPVILVDGRIQSHLHEIFGNYFERRTI